MIRSDPLYAAVDPFRRRLVLFAVLKALLSGLTAGGFAFTAATLILKAARTEHPAVPYAAAIAACAAVFAAVLIARFPSRRYTARKLDALGLKERTSTMLALREDPSEIASLQRWDALRRLDRVNAGHLREKIGLGAVLLCLLALLLAAGSVFVPDSWFERPETDAEGSVWEDVLAMLREEQARLEEQGEDVLAGEMSDLIEELEGTDSVLRALGEIDRAEEAAADAARDGEASRGAMQEMIDTLEEARRALLGEEEEGEGAEEGEQAGEGGEMEMLVPGGEGEGEEGMPGDEGRERPESGTEEGMSGPGSGEAGEGIPSNKTEPVYDPISGDVPYGDVFSAYYSDYLKDKDRGEVPYGLEEAADSYFSGLDR